MADVTVFHADGDACPVCAALDGQAVTPGFRPHDGCLCQTVRQPQPGECHWDYQMIGNQRSGNGWADVVSTFHVVVVCPDGRRLATTGQFDGHAYSADTSDDSFFQWMADVEAYVTGLAEQLCAQCAPPPPFLCC